MGTAKIKYVNEYGEVLRMKFENGIIYFAHTDFLKDYEQYESTVFVTKYILSQNEWIVVKEFELICKRLITANVSKN